MSIQQYAEVLRPFDGARSYTAGEVVNIAGWRWGRQLIERRYLAPVAAPPAEAEPERRGPGRPRREEG